MTNADRHTRLKQGTLQQFTCVTLLKRELINNTPAHDLNKTKNHGEIKRLADVHFKTDNALQLARVLPLEE